MWAEQEHLSLGPVMTKDTNSIGTNSHGHLQGLFILFQNISQLKLPLLEAIDQTQHNNIS